MHLLHRSSVFGGRAPRRGVGSSPRAHQIFSKSDSIKKRSAAGAAKGSKRARLRAGLAAALHELRLAGARPKRGSSPVPTTGTRAAQPGSDAVVRLARRAADAAAGPPCAHTASAGLEWTAATSGGGALLLLAVLALICVVALGRAPAVCCCTCAAWLCRGRSSATAAGHRHSPPPEPGASRSAVA